MSRRYRSYRQSYYFFPPRLTVSERQAKARQEVAKLEKKGQELSPVVLEGRTISATWWGQAWCRNLESYHDYENRIPRGRSYVRSGSVLDLRIAKGLVEALVSGSSLYRVSIKIKPLEADRWADVVKTCGGEIGSVIELLQGNFSDSVMRVLTRHESGLFPNPKEIKFECSCPDYALMCKHVAAALYGVGARFDSAPDLFFRLRGVDETDLIAEAVKGDTLLGRGTAVGGDGILDSGEDLAGMFGIEMAPPSRAAEKSRKAGVDDRAGDEPLGTPIKRVDGDSPRAVATDLHDVVTRRGRKSVKRNEKEDGPRMSADVRGSGRRKVMETRSTAKVRRGKAPVKAAGPVGRAKIAPRPKTATRGRKQGVAGELTAAQLKAMGFTAGEIRSALVGGHLAAADSAGKYKVTPTTPLLLAARRVGRENRV